MIKAEKLKKKGGIKKKLHENKIKKPKFLNFTKSLFNCKNKRNRVGIA
jgi:hypothetical protein